MFCSAAAEATELQKPHGGALVDVRAPADQHAAIAATCTKTVECTDRQACDVELLSYGCAACELCSVHPISTTRLYSVRAPAPVVARRGPNCIRSAVSDVNGVCAMVFVRALFCSEQVLREPQLLHVWNIP